jgi:MiaB/RimO family radical SAM methylthiotransferase
MTKKYYFTQNSCERRLVEERWLLNYFQSNGFIKVDSVVDADYLIFFACGMKEDDSYEKINELSRQLSDSANLIVFGCYPAMSSKKIKNMNIYYVPLSKMEQFDDIILASVKTWNIGKPINFGEDLTLSEVMNSWDPRLKMPKCKDVCSLTVSTGCCEQCSYCTIRYATGNLHSTPINIVKDDLLNGLSAGYKYFRFQCENLGTYGLDIGEDIGKLLTELGKVKERYSIDLPDLHPKGFIGCFNEIVNFMREKQVLLLHIPIQSGNQRILDLMNRRYRIEELKEKLFKFRHMFPNMKIGTDIIVGFPTETDSEFYDSYELMKNFDFNWIYLHGFNLKENALANKISPRVPDKVIEERIKYALDSIPKIVCYLNNYTLEK